MSSIGSDSQSSRSSFSTGTGGSELSDTSDAAGALAAVNDRDDAGAQDLLDQNKGIWDAAFSCLYLLTKSRSVTSYRMLAFRTVFEYLQIFLVFFNPSFLWPIRTDFWIWKGADWVLFRLVIWDWGYSTYLKGVFAICSIILALVAVSIALTITSDKTDSNSIWFKRLIWLVQSVVTLVFSICWVALLDYMAYMFACGWNENGHHYRWIDRSCTRMPHLGSMLLAGSTAVIFAACVVCLAIAECQSNPLTNNLLAMQVPFTACITSLLRVAVVLVGACLHFKPKTQAVFMFILPVLGAYFHIRSSPYLISWMNYIWGGLWCGLVYTSALLLALNQYEPEEPWDYEVPDPVPIYRANMTLGVLYGIFPAMLLGGILSFVVHRWQQRPLKTLQEAQHLASGGRLQLDAAEALKAVYRFRSPEEVELLARCVRRFDPVTDLPLQEAIALCGLVVQAGVARFHGNPSILLLQAAYMIHVIKDTRAARTQLQLASSNLPGVIERYNIFKALEELKSIRETGDRGLDLMAYVEFQRNFRACVKAHKAALLAQRAFWRSVMRDNLKLSDMLVAFRAMEATEQTAILVYKRVLDRYPQGNGKLLKIWGRFQEWVLHDPVRASRSYAEAVKRGLGDTMLNLLGGGEGVDGNAAAQDSTHKVDEKVDGIVIIDAAGAILLVNKAANRMFGYAKGELEGKNVSMLMPQPFSGRHNTYLNNYVKTGEAKILDSERHLVALSKDRTIFPITLVVHCLSGTGKESIFMGVIRPSESTDPTATRVWATTNGIILCSDARFADWFGMSPQDIVGRPVSTFGQNPEKLEKWLLECAAASASEDAKGTEQAGIGAALTHKHLPALEVNINVSYGGTATERILVLHIQCLTDVEKLMVVDNHCRILYATSTLAAMLSAKPTALMKLHLPQLLPPPTAQFHKPWIRDMATAPAPWPGSCRAGGVVHMQAMNGVKVPVTLGIKTVEKAIGDTIVYKHTVKVEKATDDDLLDGQRMRLLVDQQGTVTTVLGNSNKALFGFDPSTALVGRPLASFVNLFEAFRLQQQKHQQPQAAGQDDHGSSMPCFSQVALQYQLGAIEATNGVVNSDSPPGASTGTAVGSVATDDAMLLTILAQAAQEGRGASYRVGVRANPVPDDQICSTNGQGRLLRLSATGSGGANKGSAGAATSLHDMLVADQSSQKIRPAIMTIQVVEPSWGENGADGDGMNGLAGGLQFEVQLWRVDKLSGVLEVDQQLKVLRADESAGHIMGCAGAALQRKSLTSFLTTPESIKLAADLLMDDATQGKKASALKVGKNKPEVKIGPLLQTVGRHADGLPVQLTIQAVPKEGQGNKVMLRVKVDSPANTGSLSALLQLAGAATQDDSNPDAAAVASTAAAADNLSKTFKMHTGTDRRARTKAGADLLRDGLDSNQGDGREREHRGQAQFNAKSSRDGEQEGYRITARRGRTPRYGDDASDINYHHKGGHRCRDGSDLGEPGDSGSEAANRTSQRRSATGKTASGKHLGPDNYSHAGTHGHFAADFDYEHHQAHHQAHHHRPSSPAWGLQHLEGRHAPALGLPFMEVGHRPSQDINADEGQYNQQDRKFRGSAGGYNKAPAGKGFRGSAPGYLQPTSYAAPAAAKGFRSLSGGYAADYEVPFEDAIGRGPAAAAAVPGAEGGTWGMGVPMGPRPGQVSSTGSIADAGSEAASDDASRMDAASVSELDDNEGEDVSCDWRRAKRLKRILQQLDSPVARKALRSFCKGTWLAAAILMLTHIVCYAVLTSIIKANASDVYGVQQALHAVDTSQMVMLQANYISKCAYEANADLSVCSEQQRTSYYNRAVMYTDLLSLYHHGLFLGFNERTIKKIKDQRLLNYWVLPMHEETNCVDSNPPSTTTANASLWNIGNRYIYAAREVLYAVAHNVEGEELERNRYWNYISANGRASVFDAYAYSLDLYCRYVWKQLGSLGGIMTGLLVAEFVFIALAVIAWQLDLVRQVAGQRMACFSVFLALPTATLRALVTAPCQVDDDDAASEADDDDLADLAETTTAAEGAASGGGKTKSVRMSVTGKLKGGDEDCKHDDKSKGKAALRKVTDAPSKGGLSSWLMQKHKVVQRLARGTFNRTLKISGKKLQPARGAFVRFLAPLLVWWVAALIIYGVSFTKLGALQGPLTSLQASAHVQYLFARVRVLANLIGFLPPMASPERQELNALLRNDLTVLKEGYFALLYGGVFVTKTDEPDPTANAGVFEDPRIADIFFKTTNCLRLDQSTCWQQGSDWYDITHAGIDAMMQRILNDMAIYLGLPPAEQNVAASCYEGTWRFGATDMYEGLLTAGALFTDTTLRALDLVQKLHAILLAITIGTLVLLLIALLLPFKRQLVTESRRLAGLLSQLPQEADVMGHVKALVLDTAYKKKHPEQTARSWNLAREYPQLLQQPHEQQGMWVALKVAWEEALRHLWIWVLGIQGLQGWAARSNGTSSSSSIMATVMHLRQKRVTGIEVVWFMHEQLQQWPTVWFVVGC